MTPAELRRLATQLAVVQAQHPDEFRDLERRYGFSVARGALADLARMAEATPDDDHDATLAGYDEAGR